VGALKDADLRTAQVQALHLSTLDRPDHCAGEAFGDPDDDGQDRHENGCSDNEEHRQREPEQDHGQQDQDDGE
jgi:hypothetical protein